MRDLVRRTRVRLTLVYTLFFAVVACAAGGAFWLAFQQFQYSSIDASLKAQSLLVKASIQDTNGKISLDNSDQLPWESPSGIAMEAFLVGSNGTILDRSHPPTTGFTYPLDGKHLPSSAGFATAFADGQAVRILVQPVDLGNGSTGTLVLARPVAELQGLMVQTAVLLALVVGGLVLTTAALAYWLSGRALAPVRMMAATAREISEHDLHRRISLDLPRGDELAELAATFNAMLGRLEEAFDALKRFTADAAHDLRAPLALMRTQLEVILRRERTPQQYRDSHQSLLEEVERLSRAAEQLLLLARADAGSLTPRLATFEVRELLEEVRERWHAAYIERGVPLVVQAPAGGELSADPDLLRRVLDNLLDNALRHSPSGEQVTMAAQRERDGWRITVEDRGPGVDPGIRGVLFERFTRADAARGRDTGGAGLGLSLCAAIAHAHGGTIRLDENGAGASLSLWLPDVGLGSSSARPLSSTHVRRAALGSPRD